MKKQVTLVLAAAVCGLLLSSMPAAAQNQGNGNGQGPFSVNFCKPFVESAACSNADALGACVSTGNVCDGALKTGNADLFDLCCGKCFAAAEACSVDPAICTAFFGCAP
jgi:hypothetical protein